MKTEHRSIIEKSFTTKAEYLVWRATWRAAYKELTKEIREAKVDRKSKDATIRSMAQYQCFSLRKAATFMLEHRKNSKVEAQRQYLVAKATATASTATDPMCAVAHAG